MKVPRNLETQEADLSIGELEDLATDIRDLLLQGKGLTISEYIKRADSISELELGYRKTRALRFEPKLEAYFPDNVFAVLRRKGSRHCSNRFNKDDDAFLLENVHKGVHWLANRFYTNVSAISKHLGNMGVSFKSRNHIWTKKEEEFLRQNTDKGYKWIGKRLGVTPEAVRHKARKLKVSIKVQEHHRYSVEEDTFIRKHAYRGTKWISERLGHSQKSIRERAVRLKVKLPIISSGKKCHKYTKKDDKFITENSHQGAKWLADQLGVTVKSVQQRARLIGVAITVINKGKKCHKFTNTNDWFITQNAHRGAEWIANYLGVKPRSVQDRARRISVKLTPQYKLAKS